VSLYYYRAILLHSQLQCWHFFTASRKMTTKPLFLSVVLTALSFSGAWHGYNYSFSRLEDRSSCPDFIDATQPYKHDFMEKLGLWPNLMSQFDFEYGETLYGSQEALELIWRNQNPEDCSTAKYLVSGGWPYGFGSRIHMEGELRAEHYQTLTGHHLLVFRVWLTGAALGMAMHLGRVYLPHPVRLIVAVYNRGLCY
jgi:hypothetical protein